MDRAHAAAACKVPYQIVEKLMTVYHCISPQDAHVNCISLHAAPSIDLPQCICGVARSFAVHDLINLEYSMSLAFLPLTADLAAISDEDLAKN